MTKLFVMFALPMLVVYAAIGDVREMRIPNWLNLAILLLFFPAALVAGMPLAMVGEHVAVFMGLLVLGFILNFTGKFGGGDAKMMAALGIWFGVQDLPPFLIATALAGGALAIIMKAWDLIRFEVGARTSDGAGTLGKVLVRGLDLPYGVAFAVGTLFALPQSWWVQVALAG